MVVGFRLLKEGKGDVFISAGNSGALLTGATLLVGRIKGIDRPAMAPMLPAYKKRLMLIDAGANTNCKPINLVQFAQMATIYLKNTYGIEKPAFQIKTTDVMPNFKDIDELFKLENIDSKEQTDSQKSYKIVRERLTLGEERAKYQSSVDRLTAEAEKLKSQGRTSAANARYDMATHYKGSIETIDRAIASGKVTKDSLGNMVNEKVVYTNNESEVSKQYDFGVWPMANCPFEPSTGNNITSVLTEVFQICCPKTDYLPTYNFVPEYVRDYKGVAYYRMTLYVSYNQVPGLYESIRNKDEKELLNYALYGPHTIEEAQLRYLKTIIDQGALLKKYRWLLNGVEESVLS